ncbi:hypothetical protein VTJ04DRAFT_2560 [Mycothermus thermophilus]|uniref:uncharacterized protein n=1 Tax=Humicola insolens TaxID=85995 RepID=UPI003743FD33
MPGSDNEAALALSRPVVPLGGACIRAVWNGFGADNIGSETRAQPGSMLQAPQGRMVLRLAWDLLNSKRHRLKAVRPLDWKQLKCKAGEL